MFSVLGEKQRKRLQEPYKYNCQNTSLCDNLTQIFWQWLSDKIPLWIAPSALTYCGIALNIASTMVLMSYPVRGEEVPKWMYVVAALSLFIYQTLDALDGKQCYRLGFEHQALEEFTDHSCDAISTLLLSIQVCAAINFDREPAWMLFFCFFGLVLFYTTHCQIYASGIVKFGVIDVTEIQLSAITILLLRSVCDVALWDTQVPYLGINFRQSLIIAQVFGMLNITRQIYHTAKDRGGYTVAGTNFVSAFIPGCLVIIVALLVAVMSPTQVALRNPTIFLVAFGLPVVKQTSRLVVCNITKAPVEPTDASMLGGVIQLFNILLGAPLDEHMVMYAMIVHEVSDLAMYHVAVVTDICDCLGIKCFSVTPERALLVKDGKLIKETKKVVQNGVMTHED